ncbi:MAG: hypothetical protein KME60_33490 [Cyanomargarita calcarea GSE-NOS-MK-12-04C]|jgi:hypothetical protein|uniref:NHL repeat-containing protein n=1 Tax=Cyanomargarita calcarea GSE-NOS-MK-12-04C TaxID=2839659 RepID=A0A951QY54_9CYAN|nr:hypothetical protein [Cyanomargarita calcarea GSE-NOS-MK-12-04C]
MKNNKKQKLFTKRYKKLFFALMSLVAGAIATIVIGTYLSAKVAPPEISYKTSYLSAKVAPTGIKYKTTWIGNTFGNGDKWVQIRVSGMYVAPDGTVYTNSGWDEAGSEAGIYKNGSMIGKAEDSHGWGRFGGSAVTADKKYIYVAMLQGLEGNPQGDYPPKDTVWYCVRRYDLSGKPAPFTGGRGWDKSMLIVSTKSAVTGLAIAGGELYVSDPNSNRIRVYNTEMEELRSFAVANPGKIAIDKQKNLWIIQQKKNEKKGKVLHYSALGKQLPQTVPDVVEPTAIAIDNQNRLLVAENNKRQQILIYNITNKPVKVGTFGTEGGIYSGIPGEVGNLKFYGITGVGTDAKGNIYISNNGFNDSGVDLRSYSQKAQLQWRLLGLEFIDNADADPAGDGVHLFTKQEHFIMDYSKPPGKDSTYKGYTLNAFKYPQDPRLHTDVDATFFRRIQGKPFLFLTDMYGGLLEIFRFDKATDGEIAIPSGMFVGTSASGKPSFNGNWPPNQPTTGEWIWRDGNGNGRFEANEYDRNKDYPYIGGWWIDEVGDIWKTLRTQDGIRHYPLLGLDKKGNPIYSYARMEKQTTPRMFDDLRRIEYFPKTDTMYLSGFTSLHPAIGSDYSKSAGSEIARFDNWSKGNRKERWRIVLPIDTSKPPEAIPPQAISVAGDYVFAVTVKTSEVYMYNAATGAFVFKLKPNPIADQSGWVDIAYGVRAFQRKNGEYLVFVEEDLKGKVVIHRFKI